jgi:hypothetical protein
MHPSPRPKCLQQLDPRHRIHNPEPELVPLPHQTAAAGEAGEHGAVAHAQQLARPDILLRDLSQGYEERKGRDSKGGDGGDGWGVERHGRL